MEIINSTLRNAGQPVHCSWVRDVSGLGEALAQSTPQLIFLCVADDDEAQDRPRRPQPLRDPRARHPGPRVGRPRPTSCRRMEMGAQDVVTLPAQERLQAVAVRELRSARLDGALAGTLASARQYRDQMKAFMAGSADAIAHVQEGIVVDVNPAWVELFGYAGRRAPCSASR